MRTFRTLLIAGAYAGVLLVIALAMMAIAGAAMAAVLEPDETEVEHLAGLTVNATVGEYNENTNTFRVTLYENDRYDMEDVEKLTVGDILLADGRRYVITEKSETPESEIMVKTEDGYEIYFMRVEDDDMIALLEKLCWWDKSVNEILKLLPILTCSDTEHVKSEIKNYLGMI